MERRDVQRRWLLTLPMLALAALLVMVAAGGNFANAAAPISAKSVDAVAASKVDARVLQDTANGKSAEFMVVLASQADVSAARAMRDQDAQGWYVYNTLKAHAERTQASLRSSLAQANVAFKSYWVINAMLVTGDRADVEMIAARSDVARIETNRPQRWIEDEAIANRTASDAASTVIEWGVQRVNAPQVWAMGYTGQGIVVGGLDTGIRWTHNAIKNQYRGWNGVTADHNYNWWDAIHSGGGVCGPNTQAPCDDDSHGTHTVGTMVGDDGTGNQIGVAPGAKWIGCRNMDQGNGTPATYTECFQFMIAPTDLTGNNPNPALRPHVLNNSWSCTTGEGCTTGQELLTIIQNTQAAGIMVVFSAGNAGPGCGTVNTPGAMYEEAFSTGATADLNNALASFSSRGPVTRDGSNRLKPNVSAPGVSVRSATNASDTSYSNFSGTSMASPHNAGVVALFWSARPHLARDIAATKNIIQNTANPQVNVTATEPYCGGTPPTQIPNNYFGYGRVDVLAAVNSVPELTPTPVPPTVTSTAIATNTATATATVQPCNITFTDVPTTDPFYASIRCLACRGIVSGYADGTFRPNSPVTRGQLAKMVSSAAGFNEPVTGQTFQDVPPTHTFYEWIERLASRGYMTGYPCTSGSTVEPCVPPGNRPYFRPQANATRGQTAKIVANAAGFVEPVSGQTFQDVPTNHTFYEFIQRLANRNVMSGYQCGGPGEPCVGDKPYFRPGNDVTRGQSAKIVANSFFPECSAGVR